MPKALDHIALVVRDPARSGQLFARVFDDAVVHSGTGDHDTEVQLGGGICLILVAGEPPATRNGDHIAFAVSRHEQRACARRLEAMGLGYVYARGDSALYFDDYDNHVFELDVVED
ncbi:VOC family protein [Frateuria defendens]|uniref:VOC family protein n=1 Tax=Frateuria defendens TaxID=2219559 RepID=UPI00066FCF27|nr:VOC family protein [Frateuria defendens]